CGSGRGSDRGAAAGNYVRALSSRKLRRPFSAPKRTKTSSAAKGSSRPTTPRVRRWISASAPLRSFSSGRCSRRLMVTRWTPWVLKVWAVFARDLPTNPAGAVASMIAWPLPMSKPSTTPRMSNECARPRAATSSGTTRRSTLSRRSRRSCMLESTRQTMRLAPSSCTFTVMAMEASKSSPIATMTASMSPMASRARGVVSSKSMTMAAPTSSLMTETFSSLRSMANTSAPSWARLIARFLPKTPRPMMQHFMMGKTRRGRGGSGQDDGSLRQPVAGRGTFADERQQEQQHADATDEHRRDQHQLGRLAELAGHAATQAHGAHRADRLERQVGRRQLRVQRAQRDRDQRDETHRQHDDRQRAVGDVLAQSPAERLDLHAAQQHPAQRQRRHRQRGRLDAARGAGGAAAHEHQKHHER